MKLEDVLKKLNKDKKEEDKISLLKVKPLIQFSEYKHFTYFYDYSSQIP